MSVEQQNGPKPLPEGFVWQLGPCVVKTEPEYETDFATEPLPED